MTTIVQDNLARSLAFSDVTEDHSEPPVTAQFEGGNNRATIQIDYSLTTAVESSPAEDPFCSLQVVFLNGKIGTWHNGTKVPLKPGLNSIKLDTHGRAGGLMIADIQDGSRLDYLYFFVTGRGVGGS